LDIHSHTLTLNQIAEYDVLIQRTDEQIRNLRLQLRNNSLDETE
jgi:hypothetical protein